MNGNCNIVFKILNVPCADAIVIFGSKPSVVSKYWIKAPYGTNAIKQITVPITLNNTWEAATRFAAILLPTIANAAVVIAVPILSPNNTGNAPVKLKAPSAYKFCKIAIVAAEDWIKTVKNVPTPTPTTALSLICVSMFWNQAISLIGPIAVDIIFRA